MLRKFSVSVLLVSAIILGATVGPAASGIKPVEKTTYLTAGLTGAAERPGPGDPDAFGRAIISVDDGQNLLCMTLWWYNVDGTLSGLHIHLAPPTAPGPIVVPFATPPTGQKWTRQCIVVENEALLDNIAANPGQYYLNLHSTPNFGPGALRGQLTAL